MSRNRFCWTYGVLAWGVPCGVVWAFGVPAIGGADPVVHAAVAVLVWPAAGYLFGLQMWRWRQRQVRRGEGGAERLPLDD